MQDWDKVEENPLNVIGDTHEFNEYKEEMTQLQELIEKRLRVLSGSQSTVFLEDNVITFITKLLSVLESLVAFGFYWRGKFSNSSFDIINCLVKLLNICEDRDDRCTLV